VPELPLPGFDGTVRFSVNRLLGAGGMGMVYDVFDNERGERVALKSLRRADPDTLFLFKQEFRSLTNLTHRNLLSLYELFVVDGRWHFTMELLDGAVNFRRWVRNDLVAPEEPSTRTGAMMATDDDRPTSLDAGGTAGEFTERLAADAPPPAMPADVTRLRAAMSQLADGVMALHGAGMLHRDLKPENVLVTPDGRVKLLDFGLIVDLKRGAAREAGGTAGAGSGPRSHSRSVEEEYIAGTVDYMSPEQAAAQPLTPATDWYAVGVMLFEALTGRRPFAGTTREILEAKQRVDPPPPSSLATGVPPDLDTLCAALLRRDPPARPSGAEVRAVLAGQAPGLAEHAAVAADAEDAETPFVGRQDQLKQLSRAFDRARSGRVVVCRVHGRSGAGKSALVSHFQDLTTSRSEAVVLTGRCYEQESVPYKAWDSLMDSLYYYLMRQSPKQRKALLPASVAALARVFPVMKRLPGVRDAADAGGAGIDLREQRRLAFQGLGQLLGRIADTQPLVLAIDDLQWGDVDSAQLLVDLLDMPEVTRTLVITAHRSETAGRSACLDALTAAANRAPRAGVEWDVVEVAAMSEGETLQLALALLGSSRTDARPLAERILRESGGNAFFIVELARHVRAGLDLDQAVGLDLDAVLWARAQRLDEAPRRLLETVAVAGQPLRVRDAAKACGLDVPSQPLVNTLRISRFVRTSGPGFDDEIECFHDRVRETVTVRLAPGARLACHARLAAVFESSGVAEPQTIALHLRHSEPARAASFYATAGAAAVDVLAFERAEEYYREALALAGSTVEKAGIQERLIHFYADIARFRDAYATGREAVAAFGVRLPAAFNPPAFLADLAMARLRLGRRAVGDLERLPEMGDERLRWAVRLISATAKSAFQIRPELCVAISAKAVNLCLQHGNIGESAVPYMVFGAIFLGGVLGRYERGYEFGRLALDLVERFDNRKQRAEVHFVVGYFGTSWLRPAAQAEELWARAHQAGIETGDLFHTGCACAGTVQSLLMRGAPLNDVWAESERYAEWLERVQQREPLACVRAVRQTIRCLKGETDSAASFRDAAFDEDAFVQELSGFASKHFAHYYFVDKMLALYVRRQYADARRLARACAGYLKASSGMLHSAEHVFLDALIAAAGAGSGSSAGAARSVVKKACRKFERWAARCPSNFSHKHRLLAGEAARLTRDAAGAQRHYEAAIASAEEFGYRQVAAMAGERWADVLDGVGDADGARRRRAAARDAWLAWGATAAADACGDSVAAM
jgi:predicted ATPase/serine/threonine protein kinase